MLFAPLKYFSIHHPVKGRWDVVIPILLGTAMTVFVFVWPAVSSPFSEKGYINGLQSMYAILGGFFITSLTVITSIGNENLDESMQGFPVVSIGKEKDPMSRRRFLGFLFGYLSFSCFVFYLIGIFVPIIVPGAAILIPNYLHNFVSIVFVLFYNVALVHLFVTTLLGLYYFSDRLQRPKAEIIRD